MISTSSYGWRPDSNCLELVDLRRIGDLTFVQLAELRHRGAFSTVAQTFAQCCIKCTSSPIKEAARFVQGWYTVNFPFAEVAASDHLQETLLCIEEKAAALTRRSAGLPSMIVAILIAHAHLNDDTFNTVVVQLMVVAQSPVEANTPKNSWRLPQVHAMNCLKDALNSTRLGARTERHVEAILRIAAQSLKSEM